MKVEVYETPIHLKKEDAKPMYTGEIVHFGSYQANSTQPTSTTAIVQMENGALTEVMVECCKVVKATATAAKVKATTKK